MPEEYSWQKLLDAQGDKLEYEYTRILVGLAREDGVIGTIFRRGQNRIQHPAKLRRLVVNLIDKETWSQSGTDIKGDAYEELLSKGASDKGSGAGQYFTPRALIEAIVDVVRPTVADTVVDPACGTGGFLLAAHEHAARGAESMTPVQRDHLRDGFASGYELVDSTARLAAMNLLLHGMGTSNGDSLIELRDSLIADPGRRWSVVLSNPPFGRKSSLTMVGADGREVREDREIERQDFVATTSNKQLNFVQHIATILDTNGRAAVVLPDNVLFEGGAGEVMRRKLLTDFNLHTMLRLPTGIFYAQGVKANVLFFDKKVARPGQPWTERLWVFTTPFLEKEVVQIEQPVGLLPFVDDDVFAISNDQPMQLKENHEAGWQRTEDLLEDLPRCPILSFFKVVVLEQVDHGTHLSSLRTALTPSWGDPPTTPVSVRGARKPKSTIDRPRFHLFVGALHDVKGRRHVEDT